MFALKGWAHIQLPKAYKSGTPTSAADGADEEYSFSPTMQQSPLSDGEGSTFALEGQGGRTPGGSTDEDASTSSGTWSADSSNYRPPTGKLGHKSTFESIDEEEIPADASAEDRAKRVAAQAEASSGSADHGSGNCRPCAWFYKAQGCANGNDCRHCHLCPEGEIKNRKKVKVTTMRTKSSAELEADSPNEFTPAASPVELSPMKIAAGAEPRHVGAEAAAAAEAKREEVSAAGKLPPGLMLPSANLPGLTKAPAGKPSESPPALPHPLPSPGSGVHGTGACRPCAWLYKPQGCANGKDCRHCHLCPEGEIKNRKKAKIANLKKDNDDDSDDDDGGQTRASRQPPQTPFTATAQTPLPLYSMVPPVGYDPMSPMVMAWSPMVGMPGVPPMPFHPMPAILPLPSVGSNLHGTGMCRPCAWFWKSQGCANGADCFHCHLCPEGEIKDRKKAKVSLMRAVEKCGSDADDDDDDDDEDDDLSPEMQSMQPRATVCSDGESSPEQAGAPATKLVSDLCSTYPPTPKAMSTDATIAEDDDDDDFTPDRSPLKFSVDTMPMSVTLPKSLEFASTGSSLHSLGKCRPCAWHWKPQGCQNGRACAHCHMCPDGELRNRRKAKVSAMRVVGAVTPSTTKSAMCRTDSDLVRSTPSGAKSARVVKIAPMLSA